MKVSIMTLALSDNYGAALQCCGLSKALTELGVENETYRYQDWSRITYGKSLLGRAKHAAYKCARFLLTGGMQAKRFNLFRKKHIPMTEKFCRNNQELRENPGDYDVYISGSDQIWNPSVFLFDYSYFLDFVPEGKKKISYAPSFGSASFDPAYKEKCGKLLESYSCISVREKSGEAIVKELCGKDAFTVVDPTLLLTQQQWEPMMEGASQRAKSFNGILCYIMPGDKLVTDAIESLAQQLHKKTGLPIMRLGIKEYNVLRYPAGGTDIKAGPTDFLAYFAGARYVVTNSFHGTAFAMNFDKECYNPINDTLPPEKARHERILSLLTQTEATGQIISASNPVLPAQSTVNRNNSQKLLETLRQESLAYLKEALGA